VDVLKAGISYHGCSKEVNGKCNNDVGIFSKALSPDDIANIMNNGLNQALNVTVASSAGKLTTTWGEIKGKH